MSKHEKSAARSRIPLAAPHWRGIRKIGPDQYEVTLGNSVHDYCLTVSGETVREGLRDVVPLFPGLNIVKFQARH